MSTFLEKIRLAKQEKKPLFYNNSGSKKAYQLGVKHISSADFLGFADKLPNGDLRLKENLILVDFEKEELLPIDKKSIITPVELSSS